MRPFLFSFSFVTFSETVGHTIRILKQFCLDQDKKKIKEKKWTKSASRDERQH